MEKIQNISLSSLKLLDNNPRRISKDQMEKLIKSIQSDPDFLQCRPVLVNKKDNVLQVYAGNQRVQAAKKLKWKTIPCIVEEGLSEEIMNKRMILDNKSMGEWDFDILANTQEIDLLFECGFQDFELSLNEGKDVEEVLEEQKEAKNKKKKECPNCGHSF